MIMIYVQMLRVAEPEGLFLSSLVKCSIHIDSTQKWHGSAHQMLHTDNRGSHGSSDYDKTAIFWTVEVCQC